MIVNTWEHRRYRRTVNSERHTYAPDFTRCCPICDAQGNLIDNGIIYPCWGCREEGYLSPEEWFSVVYEDYLRINAEARMYGEPGCNDILIRLAAEAVALGYSIESLFDRYLKND